MEELEEVILVISHGEGWMARVQDEKDNSESEKVHLLALVSLSGQDFGSHVAWSANLSSVGATAITAFKRASEAEVDNLNIEVFVKEDIFRFQISVREPSCVDVAHS